MTASESSGPQPKPEGSHDDSLAELGYGVRGPGP